MIKLKLKNLYQIKERQQKYHMVYFFFLLIITNFITLNNQTIIELFDSGINDIYLEDILIKIKINTITYCMKYIKRIILYKYSKKIKMLKTKIK
jgi:hypothetical protein